MKKRIFIFAGIVFLAAAHAGAEQLSKIGVVNFDRIAEDYFSESAAWREIDAMREEAQQGINRISNEIEQLRAQQLEAQGAGNQSRALQLSEQIYQRQEYLKEFHSVWNNRINQKVRSISTSDAFITEVYTVISYIAESQGYSVVMRTQDPNILWYSQAVDITNMVIDNLKTRARSTR